MPSLTNLCRRSNWLFIFSLTVLSCGKNRDSENTQNHVPARTSVSLEESVNTQGCLSIPKYLQNLRKISADITGLEISKKIQFSSKKKIRANFEVLFAFGAFQFTPVNVSQLQDDLNIIQNGCESLVLTETDGTTETYLIKEHTRERLVAQSESGLRLEYRWLSPQQLEFSNRFVSYDVPCGSEKNPIFIEQTKVYDWTGSVGAKIAGDSPLEVERSYLEKISAATGKEISDFYLSGENGEAPALSTEQLRAIPTLSPLPELLQCSSPGEPIIPPDDEGGEDNGGARAQ
ncbi:MAG: hypothetical protein AB7K68_15940 [Bacteriovoracia bacterium]